MGELILGREELFCEDCKDIGIYGTGHAGKMVFEALTKMNIQVSFFMDGNQSKTGTYFCGREIVEPDRVSKEAVILIAADPLYGIHKRLLDTGLKRWQYVDPEVLNLLSEGYGFKRIENIVKKNKNKIQYVYDKLEDEKSKEVLSSILQHRMEHNLSLLKNIYDKNQYFGNDVVRQAGRNFVDCGAFTGDTLKRFLKQASGAYHYYAFEAEKSNYDTLVAYCDNNRIKNIDIYNIAVYDTKKRLSFCGDKSKEKVGGKIIENGAENIEYVQADTIDNVMESRKIDMITMDVEGAELNALRGANKSINSWHPKLAISAYHAIEHLWEIPLQIWEINSDYRIFYRHHRWNMHDTVCYAIHKEDR